MSAWPGAEETIDLESVLFLAIQSTMVNNGSPLHENCIIKRETELNSDI